MYSSAGDMTADLTRRVLDRSSEFRAVLSGRREHPTSPDVLDWVWRQRSDPEAWPMNPLVGGYHPGEDASGGQALTFELLCRRLPHPTNLGPRELPQRKRSEPVEFTEEERAGLPG